MNRVNSKEMKMVARNQLRTVIGALVATVLLSGCAGMGGASKSADAGLKRTSVSNDSYRDDRLTRTVYAATGLGLSRLEPDTSDVSGADVDDFVEPGGQITIGADLTKHLSLELHSADLGSAGISPTGRINYHLHGASALLYAGKNRHKFKRRGFSGYGRLGYGLLENSPVGDVNFVKDNATHVLVGAGLEYMTRIGLGLRGEVISYDEDILYGQLGLIYRLGKQPESRPVQIVEAPAPEPIVVPTVPAVKIVEPVVVAQPDPCDQFDGALEGINFHTDSADLTDSSVAILSNVASTISQCERPLRVTAHTDSIGSEAYNQALSSRRADSVVRFLTEQGIDASRLSAEAFGESQPIDTNETKAGRLRNRRVELIAQ